MPRRIRQPERLVDLDRIEAVYQDSGMVFVRYPDEDGKTVVACLGSPGRECLTELKASWRQALISRLQRDGGLGGEVLKPTIGEYVASFLPSICAGAFLAYTLHPLRDRLFDVPRQGLVMLGLCVASVGGMAVLSQYIHWSSLSARRRWQGRWWIGKTGFHHCPPGCAEMRIVNVEPTDGYEAALRFGGAIFPWRLFAFDMLLFEILLLSLRRAGRTIALRPLRKEILGFVLVSLTLPLTTLAIIESGVVLEPPVMTLLGALAIAIPLGHVAGKFWFRRLERRELDRMASDSNDLAYAIGW